MMNSKEFSNKTVIVSGGSSGIGLETARMFHQMDARVAVLDHGSKPDFIKDTNFRKVDVGNWDEVDRVVASLITTFNPLDIVINGAAQKIPGSILDVSSIDFEKLLRVNALGFWNVAKATIPNLLRSRGKLINICSGTSEDLPPNTDGYFGSKGTTYSLTHSLASTFAGSGITILGIAPGPVDTPLWRNGQTQQEIEAALSGKNGPKVLLPQEIASMILELASENNHLKSGTIYKY